MTDFSKECINIIQSIPSGKVMSYGQIAALAGSPRAARQVVRLLYSSSDKYNLPWYRIINSKGYTSLGEHRGGDLQAELLRSEGVLVSEHGKIDLNIYGYSPILNDKESDHRV